MGSEMEESKEFVGEKNWKKTIFGRLKPYLLCVFCSFRYAAFNIISMVCLDKGMSRYVLVAYGYVFGTVATAFLALLLERKNENKISLPACIDILLLGLLGTSGRIVFYAGMEYTSPAFASAMNNLVPSITFILAIFFRMEKLNLLKLSGQAKIAGTIIAFGGATLMTLYKDLLAAAFYIVQATAVKKYPAPTTFTTLSGLSGTIMAIIAAAVPDHRASSWRLSLNITLIAPLYIAGFNIISKVYLDKGMSVYVLVAYGVLNRILFYIGLEHTSSAFAAAMNNLTPLMTFILAILCRMEKLDISKLSGLAKLGGTIVGLGGATLMTLYKGITVLSVHNPYTHQQKSASKIFQDKKLVIGSLVLLIQTITAAALIILQTTTVRNYPAPMTLTSLISLVGTLLSTTLAAMIDHKASSWRLSWDNTLVAPIYNGIVIFGITIFVQTRVIQMRGPVFTSAFRPLTTVIVAIMALLILGEELHLGGVIGATMIILGLYAILWGKEDEKKKRLMEPVICDKEIEIKAEKQ
ncbi:hypothetical protein GH714_036808 [Hevea brasiliensis]|uniref:EamA domain-containing protein n=1 Tax=Hevea brasiliensis TaxID=3981 RepID=A0A6A6NF31_HEVBR|nr:hypothetical protein GH714_036808 [Hevea brasiliensis]